MLIKTNSHLLYNEFLVILLLLFCNVSAKQIYLSEVYRHGARYSVKDMYDFNQTKEFAGQLTSVGLREHYLLGNYIRHDYIELDSPLLNSTMNPREVEMFTLEIQRCVQSAYAQAIGLFPFHSGPQLPENIDSSLLQPPFETIFPEFLKSEDAPQTYALESGFQPVPVRINQEFFPQCPNRDVILSRRGQNIAKTLTLFQTQQAAFTDKMRKLFNLSLSESNLAGLEALADVVIADKWLDRQLPKNFTQQDFQQLYFVRGYLMTILYSDQVASILNEPYIKTLLTNMELTIGGKSGQKHFSSYSVHDLNVLPLLTYYNITSAQCQKIKFKNKAYPGQCSEAIPFAMNLIFELHQEDSNQQKYYVRVRYNGEVVKIFGRNTTTMDYEEFVAKSKQGLMDFKKQCKVKTQTEILIEQ